MCKALFGARVVVNVRILGVVGDRMVHWDGQVRLRGKPDLRKVLHAAGRAANADLTAALAAGAQPTLLLDGDRLDLPDDLSRAIPAGARITWLMPLAGG